MGLRERQSLSLAVLTGPEGGFAPAEQEMLRQQGFTRAIGLGPRILRAETAALAALAMVQALCGDGGQRPDFQAKE